MISYCHSPAYCADCRIYSYMFFENRCCGKYTHFPCCENHKKCKHCKNRKTFKRCKEDQLEYLNGAQRKVFRKPGVETPYIYNYDVEGFDACVLACSLKQATKSSKKFKRVMDIALRLALLEFVDIHHPRLRWACAHFGYSSLVRAHENDG